MSNNVTRIMDLPENITLANTMNSNPNPTVSVTKKDTTMQNTTYQTIDPHPNPYGHPPPSVPSYPSPSFQQGQGQQGLPIQPNQNQYLPPRDMPMDPTNYTIDANVQANYIPPIPQEKVQTTNEFMRRYEEEKTKELNAISLLILCKLR